MPLVSSFLFFCAPKGTEKIIIFPFNLILDCAAGNGQCIRDSLWASVRCKPTQHAWCISSKIMDCLVYNLPFPTPLILVYDPNFGSSRPRCSYCGSGRNSLSLVNPCDFLLHSMLHLPNVPAGTKQEQPYRVLGSICACAPGIPLVAVDGEVQVWNSWGNGIFSSGVLASKRRPACFHYVWRVPRNMEGFLVVGFQGSMASHQALSIIGCHALVS